MLLEFKTRRIEPNTVVLELSGRLIRGEEAQSLEISVRNLLDRDEKRLILDLTEVEYIDSTGVGIIVYCFSMTKQAGGELRIADARGRVRRQFKALRLDMTMPLYASVEAAAQAF